MYASDIKTRLAQYKPEVESLFTLLEPHILPTDLKELRRIVAEEQPRIARAERDVRD